LKTHRVAVPDVATVMSGLANRTNSYGSLRVTWGYYLDEHRIVWASSILNTVLDYFGSYSDITSVVFTGGSSLLAQNEIAELGFVTLSDPRFANLYGIQSQLKGRRNVSRAA